MNFDEEKTVGNAGEGKDPGQETENQGQGIPPVFFAQSGATGSAHSAAHGLSSNTTGFGTTGSGSVNSAASGLSSGASDFGVPEFKTTNSAAQSLSGNASSLNTGVPEFRAEKPFRTTAKSGASSGVSRNTAEAARTAGKGAKATAKATRTAGKTTQAVGRAASTAAPVAGKVASAAVQVKSVLASVMAVTLAAAGVVSVAVNPKTYTEEQDLGTVIQERKEYIPPETAKTDEDILREMTPLPTEVPITPVPETPIPETPIPETPVPETPEPETPEPETPEPETPEPETPVPETSTPEPTQTINETQPTETPVQEEVPPVNRVIMAEDGKYNEFGIPVDLYCDSEILQAGKSITFKADILGGTPPFTVYWNLDVDASDDEDYSDQKRIKTSDRHIEYTYTPKAGDQTASMMLDVWDARLHTSDSAPPNDDWDHVSIQSEESWKGENPRAGKPKDEHFPFVARTKQKNVKMRSYPGTDSPQVHVLPDAGTKVYVYGKAYDNDGGKWYKVRADLDHSGLIRSDMLRTDSKNGTLENELEQAREGHYNLRAVPVDVYSDHEVYRANESVTFSADILGGTPPFEISWHIGGATYAANSPVDEYLETHPDYPTSAEYTTDDRRIEFTYTPPVENGSFGVYLTVKDALGVDSMDDRYLGPDTAPDFLVCTSEEWYQNSGRNAVPQEEQFPFVAATNTENVKTRSFPDSADEDLQVIPDKGTLLKVTGRSFDKTGTKLYRVRLAMDMVGYIRADLSDKIQETDYLVENAKQD